MKTKKKLFAFVVFMTTVTLLALIYKYKLVQPTSGTASEPYHAEGLDDHDSQEKGKVGDVHDSDNGHSDEDSVRLTKKEMEEFGIEVAAAGPGNIQIHESLPGEVVLNADRVAHVVPRVSGIVREVRKTWGDVVRKGEVLAVLDSRELADAKSAFLAAQERIALAKANFKREEKLWRKRISAEIDYLEAKQALAEARIELRSAEQKLHVLGFSEDFLGQLPSQPDVSFTRYEMIAPFDGTVIEKHITLGEVLSEDAQAYVVADLSSVWVNISVYPKDLPLIQQGLPVVVSTGQEIQTGSGTISYVGPLVGESTRTALARVVLPNSESQWRPGMFITASITVDSVEVPVVVPKTSFQTIDGKTSVFIETGDGFSPEPVTIGRINKTNAEITSGLKPGQSYVTKGAFTLKAQLSKGAFGDGHGH